MSEDDHRQPDAIIEEIDLLSQKYEQLSKDVSKLLSNENELYAQQLNEITKNHEFKLSLLEQWREDSHGSIEKDRDVKLKYFEEDRLIKKAEIPIFMKQSIQKQFDSLKAEFSDAFNLFLDQDIPLINEFSRKEPTSVYEVDQSQQPFLPLSEIKKDEAKIRNSSIGNNIEFDYHIGVLGEFTNDKKTYHLGSEITIQFEHMSPIRGKITRINNHSSTIEILAKDSSAPIAIPLKSINSHIVQII